MHRTRPRDSVPLLTRVSCRLLVSRRCAPRGPHRWSPQRRCEAPSPPNPRCTRTRPSVLILEAHWDKAGPVSLVVRRKRRRIES